MWPTLFITDTNHDIDCCKSSHGSLFSFNATLDYLI